MVKLIYTARLPLQEKSEEKKLNARITQPMDHRIQFRNTAPAPFACIIRVLCKEAATASNPRLNILVCRTHYNQLTPLSLPISHSHLVLHESSRPVERAESHIEVSGIAESGIRAEAAVGRHRMGGVADCQSQ
jgi:hypothetical protein